MREPPLAAFLLLTGVKLYSPDKNLAISNILIKSYLEALKLSTFSGADMALTADEIRTFNQCYGKACELLDGFLFAEASASKPISLLQKIKARKAIKELQICLSIHPQHYHSIFIIGKIHQKLGDQNEASLCFEKANAIRNSFSTVC